VGDLKGEERIHVVNLSTNGKIILKLIKKIRRTLRFELNSLKIRERCKIL
jgi:hypothetical protein